MSPVDVCNSVALLRSVLALALRKGIVGRRHGDDIDWSGRLGGHLKNTEVKPRRTAGICGSSHQLMKSMERGRLEKALCADGGFGGMVSATKGCFRCVINCHLKKKTDSLAARQSRSASRNFLRSEQTV